MPQQPNPGRRTLINSAAALAAAGLVPTPIFAAPGEPSPMPNPNPDQADKPKAPQAKPGDFDFLHGNWKIKHRRRKAKGTEDWDEFEGEATCWTILAGVGSVEELRIPSRNFAGMGLRLLDVEKKIWNDFWVNAKSGVLTTPGQTGHFENGVGTFTADDMDEGKPIKVKGIWDKITPNSCRWYQSVSWDNGQTWEVNWWMEWTKA